MHCRVIFYFHVNQNFVLSEFVLSGFHCTYCKHTTYVHMCIHTQM